MIKYQANHVSPIEIENILHQHPAIKDCVVFGKNDPEVQELISAAVVLKNNEKDIDKEIIRDFVNKRVKVDYKRLRGDIMTIDYIPRNSTGKQLRREIRKWAEKQ